MWGAFVALFRFFSVTFLNSCYFVLDQVRHAMAWLSSFCAPIKFFVLDHLHLAMARLSSFSVPVNITFVRDLLYLVVLALFTFFSFQIKNFLWDHLKNILPVGSNVDVLNREFNILKDTLKDVEDQIHIQMGGVVKKKVTEQVGGWMKRVKVLEPTVESVIADFNNRSYFSNIYSINTRAVNKLKMVREEANFIKGVKTYTRAASLPSVQQMSVVPIEFGREMFESRLQEALNFLRDDKEGVLGIWGMAGMGKTTLLQHINNTMVKNLSSFGFDKVVFVTASRESTTLNIQRGLVNKLGLPEGSDERAIFNNLFDKNFAILLDDLWKSPDLKEVGVPLPLGIVGEHKLKRKLILTTRSQRVCNKMGARHTIIMKCLSTEDARLLFRYNAGVDAAMIQSNSLIGELADKVADECDGLPLALITTGQALAETETIQAWKCAHQLLRESKLSQIPGLDDLLPLLKISYDCLKDREKECFLHCALWPEEELIPKDELIQCWMGHGLLGESDSIQKAYNTGHAIIDSLVKVCLLENPKFLDEYTLKNDKVKLHDVIRDMALWIAQGCGVDNDNKWVVLSGGWETAPRDKQTWSEVHKMTLMGPCPSDWPFENQNCPNLTTLIIKFDRNLDVNKMSILKHLNALTFLDLSYCSGVKEFPIEICGLNKLEYLNLSYTFIGCSLPEELKNLKNLKHLLLRNARVSTVPDELLSNLVSLRELDLFDTRAINCQSLIIDRLDVREGCLDSLGISVSSVLDFQKLTRLPGIFVRALCIKKIEDWTSPSLQLLSPEFLGSHNIKFSLKTLAIVRSKSIKELVIEEKCSLTSLDRLDISYCMGLKGIISWKGVKPMEVFPNLRSLFISNCHQLKNVAWIANLPCLEHVELIECSNMEQLVIWEQGTEGEESSRIFFPYLRILKLQDLPNLSNICDPAVTFYSLEYLSLMSCLQLMKLPFQSPASCPGLKRIRAEKSWWDGALQLEGDMKVFLDPLVQFH